MNIKQAKDEIQYAIKAYFTKDEFGNYVIPIERQRPIFLMGPPGIGKTAIMEQIANELGYNLDQCGYPHKEEEILAPMDLMQRYQEERASLNAEIDRVLAELSGLLGGAVE